MLFTCEDCTKCAHPSNPHEHSFVCIQVNLCNFSTELAITQLLLTIRSNVCARDYFSLESRQMEKSAGRYATYYPQIDRQKHRLGSLSIGIIQRCENSMSVTHGCLKRTTGSIHVVLPGVNCFAQGHYGDESRLTYCGKPTGQQACRFWHRILH